MASEYGWTLADILDGCTPPQVELLCRQIARRRGERGLELATLVNMGAWNPEAIDGLRQQQALADSGYVGGGASQDMALANAGLGIKIVREVDGE